MPGVLTNLSSMKLNKAPIAMIENARLHELGYEFFVDFARMEYALKAARYLKRTNGRAEASWEAFAASIDPAFVVQRENDGVLRAAVEGILAEPPKKQIVIDSRLSWSAVAPQADSETDLLLHYVRRVRNNLFHGGKFNGVWFDPERAEFLIPKCLIVLDACRNCSPEVKEAHKG